MKRIIKSMEKKYLLPSLELVQEVFTEYDSPKEGKIVRRLVEEIRAKKYYIPELELIMVNENDEIMGYAMFSRFHIEGKYENELLILTPVAVKTRLQRQHISKELLEYGFDVAKRLGFQAILVEGNPRNYNNRGFQSSYQFGIEAGSNIKLPRPDCLMVKELERGALERMSGFVDYSFYEALHEEEVVMNAKLLGFFSGFPTRHFPVDIADRLKEELVIRDSLVFVSAWPSDYERNDCDSAGMNHMFEECQMSFKRYSVIDNRTDALEAKRLIQEASCIFLMGGHAVQQFQLICHKGIADEIRKSGAVILGVSAGSYNMAKRALDIGESPVPYDGLGLADITVKAHFSQDNQELLQTLLQISVEQNLPIYAMENESAIFIKDEHVTYTGNIHLVKHGSVCPLSLELLKRNLKRNKISG